ncbi:uncharacterized protein C5L36_0E04170 [Pichia kudriavzevii]|uniref:Uncharacterized protein n=1 Tax=Pichia kudriavzevii TaxID=4909 RepID=A0A2U9RAA1_PICKU|nr:uncharacterized protein C5L36_0E04170 [Pichia kudriavzevii]AWU78362.1 hypothetical protein C5L36_0E04170 [Pichia kudriavzevii]
MYKQVARLQAVARYSTEPKAAPPSFFHNQSVIPLKHGEAVKEATVAPDTVESGPKAMSLAAPAAPAAPLKPPTVFGGTSNGRDSQDYFSSYKEFCRGMAYLGVGIGVVYFMFDQHERLDESERHMKVMRKKQRELATQMQTYKSKLNKMAVENAKKNVLVQGKMQMHIALLRQQLEKAGMKPVSIEEAIDKFQESVKVEVVGNAVSLWVPGEDDIKRSIPDPHEYKK